MNTATMRRIDAWFGGPACAVLTVVRRVTDPFRAAPPAAPQRILVVKLAEQGAWVVAYSALARAIDLVGRDNVFVMTFDENRFVLDQLDLVPAENVLVVRTTGPVATMLDIVAALRRVRRERVDAMVDFEFFARSSAIIGFLSGAARRVGFHAAGGEASYRGDLMTHRLAYNARLHAAEVFSSVVEALTLPAGRLPTLDVDKIDKAPPPLAEVTRDERDAVSAVVRELLGGGSTTTLPRLVLLNANAGDLLPLRRWPPGRYVELARRLLDLDDRVAVLFTGSPAERAEAERLAGAVGSERCASIAGRTSLRELVVLYGISELLVTNDSGPAHYAALAPIDVVTLFGPESPHVFGSLSPRNESVWAALPCSPCVNAFNDRVTACTDNVCMQRIGVDEVVEVARRHLADRERLDLGS